MLATVSASDATKPTEQAPYQYEMFTGFVPEIGWRVHHRLSFPCLSGQEEITKHFLFGKTNEHEIKFRNWMCHPGTLLCVACEHEPDSQMFSIVLAETENDETWPDTIVDHLQPKKGIDEIHVPLECEFVHYEWDEVSYWVHEEDSRKADFLLWISTHRW